MTFPRSLPTPEQRQAEKDARRAVLCQSGRGLHRGTYTGETTAAAPKTEARRNPALLEMARGRPCLLCPPKCCSCTPGSVVACHSNLMAHGKAKGRKADDCYSVWGGDFAHHWLDRSAASRGRKESAFMAAHLRQVAAWREIATDPAEPERFRRAARWALEQLNATPITEAP